MNFPLILSEIGRYEVARKGQICDIVFIGKFCFGPSWNAQCFFDNFVKLIQTRKHLECEDFERSSTLHGSWMRLIFRMSLLFTLSKSLYLATSHRKSIKIQQIQSKLFKLKPLDEIFSEMPKNSIALKLTIYLVIWINTSIQLCRYIKLFTFVFHVSLRMESATNYEYLGWIV